MKGMINTKFKMAFMVGERQGAKIEKYCVVQGFTGVHYVLIPYN